MKPIWKHITSHWLHNPVRMILTVVLLAFVLQTAGMIFADAAYAIPKPLMPRGTCSDDPDFEIKIPPAGGLITNVVNQMQAVLAAVSQNMYNSIIANADYVKAVQAAALLYIMIGGLVFTSGVSQVTVAEITIRGVKLGIVAILIGGGSWAFFNSTVVKFFNEGTDEIIAQVITMAVGGVAGGNPFAPLDNAIMVALSSKMLVTVMATFFTGPNGVIIGLILMSSLGSFLRAVLNGMWVYLMALVLKTLMFGIAPLFIPMILFTRTKHLFDGWLNQVVNACLQPIMLFAFFSFFVQLIMVMINKLLSTPVCWTGWHESLRGSPFTQHWWRFTVEDTDNPGAMLPFGGTWDFTGAPTGEIFPLNILDVLIFMMLAELAVRFNAVVIEIAKDISGAATNLSGSAGGIQEWFESSGGAERPNAAGAGRPGNLGKGGKPPGAPGWRSAKPPPSGDSFMDRFRNAFGGRPDGPDAKNSGLFGADGIFSNTTIKDGAARGPRGVGAPGRVRDRIAGMAPPRRAP